MDRRFALVALWVVFAAAAVGVGFGAAGLVGDPFTGAQGITGTPGPAVTTLPTGPVPPSSTPAPARTSTPASPRTTPRPTSPPPAATTDPGRTDPVTSAPAPPVTTGSGSRATTGGTVFARCRSGLVSVSASPAVGWELKDLTGGPARDARVRFEPAEDANGAEVEVHATCPGSAPVFTVARKGD